MTGSMWGMTDQREILGQKVEQARLARGWGKERAAREAGISAITWKRIEDGLSVHDAKRYAALKVLDLDELGEPVRAAEDDEIDQLRADAQRILRRLDELRPPKGKADQIG